MKRLLFICGPNAGMMDMWLPVVWKIKQRDSKVSAWCFFSTIKNSKDFGRTKSALKKISEETFSKFVSPSPIGGFFAANTIFELIDSIERQEAFGQKVLAIVNRIPGGEITRKLFLRVGLRIGRILLSNRNAQFLKIQECQGVVLSDLEMLKKNSGQIFFQAWNELDWYSLLHGINLQYDYDNEHKTKNLDLLPNNLTAFLFSPNEKDYYIKKYGLTSDQLIVVGVPRHERAWIDYIKDREMEREKWLKKGYIFLISKAVSDRLPAAKKREYLISIRDVVCREFGLELIIKTHPKAGEESVYEEVFSGHDNVRWCMDGRHPFVLGSNSIFAITFYSGVPLDLLSFGVPTIEYLNLVGIPEFDHNESSRNEDGEPILYYQEEGFVIGVGNETQLRKQVRKILDDRHLVVADLIGNYQKTFPIVPDVTTKMASIIETSWSR
jgi:hypothetical protein